MSAWQGPDLDLAPDLVALPKVHLHLHLVGGMRPATLRELAARDGTPLPPALSAAGAHDPAPLGGWTRFDALYVAAKRTLRRPVDLVRLVREIAEDEAAAGSAWVEITANPGLYGGRFGPDEAVLELLLDAGRAATRRTGVGVAWVVSADRRHPQHAQALARLAARHASDGVVGFGLANDERANPASAFAGAFAVARAAGLLAVPHAGELDGARAVADALDLLGADRVGHGVAAAADPRLLERIARRGVCLEVCPASNVALGVTAALADHPLPQLLAAGCRVTLGADDPLLFGSGLVAQYAAARHDFGLPDAALARIARDGVLSCAAPDSLKRTLLGRLDGWAQGLAA